MNSEAALLIGLITSVIAAAVEQLSGPGIFIDGQPGQTVLNILTVLAPIIAGAFTRFQVYSKQSVAAQLGVPVSELPPPPANPAG